MKIQDWYNSHIFCNKIIINILKTDLKCVHSFQWKIIRFAKYKSSSYTNDLWICCDADCWFDLLRIYDKIVLDFMLCIYFSALIFSGNGNGTVTAGGKYGISFIYWSKWCFQLSMFWGGIWKDDIFPKTHTHTHTLLRIWKVKTLLYYNSEGSRRRFRNFPFVSLFCKSNS